MDDRTLVILIAIVILDLDRVIKIFEGAAVVGLLPSDGSATCISRGLA